MLLGEIEEAFETAILFCQCFLFGVEKTYLSFRFGLESVIILMS